MSTLVSFPEFLTRATFPCYLVFLTDPSILFAHWITSTEEAYGCFKNELEFAYAEDLEYNGFDLDACARFSFSYLVENKGMTLYPPGSNGHGTLVVADPVENVLLSKVLKTTGRRIRHDLQTTLFHAVCAFKQTS